MMKVTAFVGSPRRNGNTDILVQRLVEGLHSPESDHEIIYLSDYSISGCRGCYSCSRTGKCINEDDMMGYTIEAMKRPFEDLGIKVIKEIRYYNTRKLPVRNNMEFQNEIIQIGKEQSSFI